MSSIEEIADDARDEITNNKYITVRNIIADNCGMTLGKNDLDEDTFNGTIEQWENFKAELEDYLEGN